MTTARKRNTSGPEGLGGFPDQNGDGVIAVLSPQQKLHDPHILPRATVDEFRPIVLFGILSERRIRNVQIRASRCRTRVARDAVRL